MNSGTTGQAIADALLNSLTKLGLTSEILKSRLLGFCTDGASNLHGSVKGALRIVADKLERDDLILFHCMNHKLELAVHDAVTATNKVSHLKMFMDTLYAYYSRSPRNCRLLEAISESLGTEIRKIGKVFDVRWLSSSYRAVDAVFKSLPALVENMRVASSDSSTSNKDKAKAAGMVKRMESWSFLMEIAMLHDVLECLQSLSLFLQKQSASVIDAKDKFDTTMRTLSALKTVDGMTMSQVNMQILSTGTFSGISLSRTAHDVEVFTQMRRQFIQALMDNLSSRFPERLLLEAGAVLSETSWPASENDRALFGDKEVLKLATLCKVVSKDALDDFRQFKNNTKRVGNALKLLLKRIQLIPVSSADCERGFSCMNMNNTAVRNTLSIDSLSALIFIKVNGPPPSVFNPQQYVERWLQSGRHAADDPRTGKQSVNATTSTVSAISTLF